MSNKRYGNFLTILLVIAIIAILVLVGYFVYDIYRKYDSNKKAEEAVDTFQQQFLNNKNNNSNLSSNTNNIQNENIIEENSITENQDNLSEENNNSIISGNNKGNKNSNTNVKKNNSVIKNKYEGYTMLGTIEIPKIKLKTPILKELSPDALKKATCFIYGNLNEEGNSVIIGHNNRNGTFFSNLKKLSNGDKITITDYTGQTVDYEVYNMFQASPDDTSFYQRDTNGLKEITLSTCTDSDDTKRIIVLAREI